MRSTLSRFITLGGLEAAKHPLICRYKKGLYNINPSLPKYSFIWDIGIVVKHLSGISNNLKQGLSGKLASLLAISCCQRARKILAVMNLRNISFEKDAVIICIGDFYSETEPLLRNFISVKLNFQAVMIRQFAQWKF